MPILPVPAKRALVISGGGVKGAYAAAAALVLMAEEKVEYDIFCGCSAGAICAAFLAQFGKGMGPTAATELAKLWLGLTADKVFDRWTLGEAAAIWKQGAYDATPLHKLIRGVIQRDKIRFSEKRLRIVTTDLDTGLLTTFHELAAEVVDAIIASASVPGAFAPVEINGHLHADGGVLEIVPIQAALDAGATHVDAVVLSPVQRQRWSRPSGDVKTLDIVNRVIGLMTDEILDGDFPDVEQGRIRILRPTAPLADDLLDFKESTLRRIYERGLADARRVFSPAVRRDLRHI